MSKPFYSIQEAKEKLAHFCAYQERSHKEVEEKLRNAGMTEDEAGEVIVWLLQENYLNESRFAKAYTGGKFRIKKWGKRKIKEGLKQKGVSERCIQDSWGEIEDDDYFDTALELMQQKIRLSNEDNPFRLKKKVSDYLLRKGYEYEIIKLCWSEIYNKN